MGLDRFGYMCKVDFDWELSEAAGGTRIFASIKDLQKYYPCVAECGIVKVRVTFEELVQDSNYGDHK